MNNLALRLAHASPKTQEKSNALALLPFSCIILYSWNLLTQEYHGLEDWKNHNLKNGITGGEPIFMYSRVYFPESYGELSQAF